ncbi:MAG TPA: sigma-70 family RNA polymerase sigma factor [Planctomycetota bacterium]|nr:sigma-70 family RNA polymerase sigma factor [Planctomycetota bacterium]
MDHRRFLKHFLPTTARIRAYLLAATGDLHEAEDLLQEVSSVLWERFSEYDEARPFEGWAIGVARLEVLKWRQKKARSRLVLSEEAVSLLADTVNEVAAEADGRRPHLAGCLERLGDKAREVLALRYEGGLSIKEVAARLGKNVGAIEMALTRSRRALQECIDRKVGRTESA